MNLDTTDENDDLAFIPDQLFTLTPEDPSPTQ